MRACMTATITGSMSSWRGTLNGSSATQDSRERMRSGTTASTGPSARLPIGRCSRQQNPASSRARFPPRSRSYGTRRDTAQSFAAALTDEGLTLAIGRRDLVVLDQAGDVHTLARCLNVKVADIRERMAGIDRSELPTVEQVRDAIRERNAEREEIPRRYGTAMPLTRTGTTRLSMPRLRWKRPCRVSWGRDRTGEHWRGRQGGKNSIREMALYLWHEADKERRAEHQPQQPGAKERQQELDRDR